MASKKLYIVNERMLKWMDYSIQVGKAENQKDWGERIGFPHTNISQVRSGVQGFTLVQIEQAARLIKGNINWLFGLEANMLREAAGASPLELLKAATAAIETQYGLNGHDPSPRRLTNRSNKSAKTTGK